MGISAPVCYIVANVFLEVVQRQGVLLSDRHHRRYQNIQILQSVWAYEKVLDTVPATVMDDKIMPATNAILLACRDRITVLVRLVCTV